MMHNTPITVRPTYIFHADWGTAPSKRWCARATLGANGRYTAYAPTPTDNPADLIPLIQKQIKDDGCALVAFDFPIGIPAPYARIAGVADFKTFLQGLGHGEWNDFYNVSQTASEISIHRPFYPFRPGHTRQTHLLSALGLNDIGDLRRDCEKQHVGRRAACPLFWTLGANQVGKAAIIGWRDVLAPALGETASVCMWPFDGSLDDLLRPGYIIVAETYPAEYYGWFFSEPLMGKGKREVRRGVSGQLLKWAETSCVELEDELVRTIENGFPDGDDAFDAVVGLFGMLDVVEGRRRSVDPTTDKIRKIEGWILGQSS